MLLCKQPVGSVLAISTWQTAANLLIFEKMCLGIGCTLGKKQISSASAGSQKKKEQFLRELFKVEVFPTSCPQVFLALSAAPKDLAPTEVNGFLHCCMGEIQLVAKGS